MNIRNAESEVVDLCQELIRIDSSNPTSDEAEAATWVAGKLREAGLETERIESAPGRASVFTRIKGSDASRGALMLHAHTDVVPADPAEWEHPPFAGEIHDGFLWGRGAIDMKDTAAVYLSVAREIARSGFVPPRDLVFAFLADEEAGGAFGSHWLVDNRPDLFDGVTEAIGEGGGFSFPIDDTRNLYPIETAQRGQAWLRLKATGRAGHGSSPNDENAVTRLAQAVAAIGEHKFPAHLIDAVHTLAHTYAELMGQQFDDDDIEGSIDRLGVDGHELLDVISHNSANPTVLAAGYQTNVIPGTAEASIDGRFLPGQEDALLAEIDALLPEGVTREFIHEDTGMETPYEGTLVDAMVAAITAEDPNGTTAPYCNAGGTDAKAFSELGIHGYGFKALKMPNDINYTHLFHAANERVPLDGLTFGSRVIGRLVETC